MNLKELLVGAIEVARALVNAAARVVVEVAAWLKRWLTVQMPAMIWHARQWLAEAVGVGRAEFAAIVTSTDGQIAKGATHWLDKSDDRDLLLDAIGEGWIVFLAELAQGRWIPPWRAGSKAADVVRGRFDRLRQVNGMPVVYLPYFGDRADDD